MSGGRTGTSVPDTAGALKSLAKKKIYFGHQSVGFNIIEGINDILRENPGAGLNVVKTSDPAAFKAPVFAHSPVGENGMPETKVREFALYMEKGIAGAADAAFFKFCYVDINRETDIGKVFLFYKETMERLKRQYPKTRFVHVTVPLTVYKPSVKALVKNLIGRTDNNIKRNMFNGMLHKEYDGREPVFDLALIESTHPDGKRESFTSGGNTYYSLTPEYTEDGSHLNAAGRRVAAVELLRLLGDVVGE